MAPLERACNWLGVHSEQEAATATKIIQKGHKHIERVWDAHDTQEQTLGHTGQISIGDDHHVQQCHKGALHIQEEHDVEMGVEQRLPPGTVGMESCDTALLPLLGGDYDTDVSEFKRQITVARLVETGLKWAKAELDISASEWP